MASCVPVRPCSLRCPRPARGLVCSGLDFEPHSHSQLSVANYMRWCSGEAFSSAENEVASSEKICTQIEKRGVMSEEMKNRAWEWIHGCINLEVREQPGEPARLPFVFLVETTNKGYSLFWYCEATLSTTELQRSCYHLARVLQSGRSFQKPEGNGQLSFGTSDDLQSSVSERGINRTTTLSKPAHIGSYRNKRKTERSICSGI